MFDDLLDTDKRILTGRCNFDKIKHFVDGATPDNGKMTNMDRLLLSIGIVGAHYNFKYDSIPTCAEWTECKPDAYVAAALVNAMRVHEPNVEEDNFLCSVAYLLSVGVKYFGTSLPRENILHNLPYRFPEIIKNPYSEGDNCFLHCIVALSEIVKFTLRKNKKYSADELHEKLLSQVKAGVYVESVFDEFWRQLQYRGNDLRLAESGKEKDILRIQLTDAAREDVWLAGMEDLRINNLEVELGRFRDATGFELSIAGTCCLFLSTYMDGLGGKRIVRKSA